MPDVLRRLGHLRVTDRVRPEDLVGRGHGNPKIRPVEQRADGKILLGQVKTAFADAEQGRAESSISIEELKALGSFVTIEGGDAAYPLALDSLERWSKHRKTAKLPWWLLMSSTPATAEQPERAVVWIADSQRVKFLKLFEDYLTKVSKRAEKEKWETPDGNPANRALVANIASIRATILQDLWQSDGTPDEHGTC